MTGDFNNSFYLGAALGFVAGCLGLVAVIRMHCMERPVPHNPHIINNNRDMDIEEKHEMEENRTV